MAARIYPVDWREEFQQLAPYLQGRGGVVRVRYAGARCAQSAFLGTLTSEYEYKEDNSNWRSLRIDREVYSVRYLTGIRDEFVRLMKVDLPKADGAEEAPGDLRIGTEIEAESVDLDVTLQFGGENAAVMSRNRDRWVNALCGELARFLKAHHMMVVVNHGEPDSQGEFWRYMWRDALEGLVESGLLLVHMVDVSDVNRTIHDLAPQAQYEVVLPTTLSPRARGEAIVDLTGILTREFPAMPAERALGTAQALVTSHVDDIPRLHDKYAACVMELRREFG
jgi:hypothetical protein